MLFLMFIAPIDFNFLSTKTTTSLDLSNNQNILNGRLDNNLLNNNFSDLNLQQEEDLCNYSIY